jgi:Xaa-Pro aminopeptidase
VEAKLGPGVPAAELDQVCRTTLEREDRPGHFPHHTGHGVGLLPHEPPYLIPGSSDVIHSGDVICVEPGLYFPGRGGVRLEEVYYITDDGIRPLTRYPRRLTRCN